MFYNHISLTIQFDFNELAKSPIRLEIAHLEFIPSPFDVAAIFTD